MEQSRRASPELVERGRLKITQDASPGRRGYVLRLGKAVASYQDMANVQPRQCRAIMSRPPAPWCTNHVHLDRNPI
jgi:hypothetical protein